MASSHRTRTSKTTSLNPLYNLFSLFTKYPMNSCFLDQCCPTAEYHSCLCSLLDPLYLTLELPSVLRLQCSLCIRWDMNQVYIAARKWGTVLPASLSASSCWGQIGKSSRSVRAFSMVYPFPYRFHLLREKCRTGRPCNVAADEMCQHASGLLHWSTMRLHGVAHTSMYHSIRWRNFTY